MNKVDETFEKAILNWRDKAGIGTALIPAPLNDKCMLLGVLQRVYARSPTAKTMIVTNNFQERQDVISFITKQGCEENDKEFSKLISDGNIKVLTYDFVAKISNFYIPFLFILYHPISINGNVQYLLRASTFKLTVLNTLMSNKEDMVSLYKICPLLDDFKAKEIEEIRLSAPVEEVQIGVEIPENTETAKLVAYYNEYITTSINIFGSFDIMQQARTGNSKLNISANQICLQIAQENGWNDKLDMSTEFNIQIDNLYNPINLKDRASNTYEMIRLRSNVLSDYNDKLEEIRKIVINNPSKKILIINKRGDFASIVTDYLNTISDSDICGNYHDKVDKTPMVDEYGDIVYYKSGSKKGEPRLMGADAQKTYNQSRFNRGVINVLSTNNAPDKDLSIEVDIVIITSPQCESIRSYMYRLANMRFKDKLYLYTIYCKGTTEQRLLEGKERSNNHTIINGCETKLIAENNSDFIVVD